MKKYLFILTIAIILLFTACGKSEASYTEKSPETKGEEITKIKSVEVTNASGETVTNANGEAVTEEVAVEKVTKVETVAVTNKNGEKVTNKSGEAVTEKKTITEYVPASTPKKEENLNTKKVVATTKNSTTTTAKKTEETTKQITTKPTTTVATTTTTQVSTTKSSQKTTADLPYRNPTNEETEIFNLINQARQEDGDQKLNWNPTLAAMANIRVQEFASNTSLAHSRPDGTKWSSIFKEYSITSTGGGGENLCMVPGTATTAETIHTTFMDSPSHKNNLLGEAWTSCGIAIYRQVENGITKTYCCEIFTGKQV